MELLTGANRMYSSAGGSNQWVSFHSVNKQFQGGGLKIHITVQSQDKCIVSDCFNPVLASAHRQKFVRKKVIHVHDLKADYLK